MATRTDVMTTLCTAFGVFSAFGAAILAFFTGGGGLQRISSWLVRRKEKTRPGRGGADGEAVRQGHGLVWLIASVVALAVIVSGIGLFSSFYWLVASAGGTTDIPKWAYDCAEAMFYIEAVVVTLITVTAIISTAVAALPNSKTTS